MSFAARIVLALVAAAVLLGIVPVLWTGFAEAGPRAAGLTGYVGQVLGFTLLQAGVSTFLALALAVPVARALNGTAFPGRPALLALFAVPLGLPAIVAILGLVAIFGENGVLPLGIYGLKGILIAHVFFNLPLAARFLLQRLEAIPEENWRLADQLGLRPRDRFLRIEWPAMRAVLPGIALLVFLLCAASFAVVLTLGGGPQATTLEVAIYQSLRFDYDPALAGALALVQLALCAGLIGLSSLLAVRIAGLPAAVRHIRSHRALRPAEAALLASASLFVLAPIAAVIGNGLAAPFVWSAILPALAASLAVAAVSTVLCLSLAWPLAREMAVNRSRADQGLVSLAALAALAIPPAVLATGWFLMFRQWPVAPLLVIALNALMALPFSLAILGPAMQTAAERHDRLCLSLQIGGWTRFRLIDVPALRRPLGFAAGVAAILSLGDLTAISLFGTQDFATLPVLIQRQMGSYRLNEAAATALVLAVLCTLIIVLPRLLGNRK